MITKTSVSSEISDADFRTKEVLKQKVQEASEWKTDIVNNKNRLKLNYCEICNSKEHLEQHHVRGRKHGNEIITVCQECHNILTDKQRLWDRSWHDPDSSNKDSFLIRGLIDVFELKYEKTGFEYYKEMAKQLTKRFKYD